MIGISFITTSIGLSCEDYTNQGGNYEMYKEEIERITDPFSWCQASKLRCERSGLNGNPVITITGSTPSKEELVNLIEQIENRIRSRLKLSLLSYTYYNP